MRPSRKGRPSPFELNARVVPLLLGEERDPCDESERLAEVLEGELPRQPPVLALPPRDETAEPLSLRLRERWASGRVLVAVLVEELGDT